MNKTINGFSKLSKVQKIQWVADTFAQNPESMVTALSSWQHQDPALQKILDGFTENALSNYPLPYSIAPNVMVNGKVYAVPMVIEESSVVAAASSAAKFWLDKGGFHAEVLGTVKLGQVHFRWHGAPTLLQQLFPEIKELLIRATDDLTANMRQRGGGIIDLELIDFTHLEPGYYQIRGSFDTRDSMGANFINSVLERFGNTLEQYFNTHNGLSDTDRDVEIVMCILSNYTPECLVRAWVECPVGQLEDLARHAGLPGPEAVDRICTAVRIAVLDPYRATTHNKGIFNGIDAVIMATWQRFQGHRSLRAHLRLPRRAVPQPQPGRSNQ